MMKRWTKNLLLVLLIVIAVNIPFMKVATISSDDKIIDLLSVKEWQHFQYTYIHSVNHSEIKEYYEMERNRFVLKATCYSNQGAGIVDVLDEGASFEVTDEGFMVKNINRVFDSFQLYADTQYKNTISNDTYSIYLYELVNNSGLVTIKIKRISLFTYIIEGL